MEQFSWKDTFLKLPNPKFNNAQEFIEIEEDERLAMVDERATALECLTD